MAQFNNSVILNFAHVIISIDEVCCPFLVTLLIYQQVISENVDSNEIRLTFLLMILLTGINCSC